MFVNDINMIVFKKGRIINKARNVVIVQIGNCQVLTDMSGNFIKIKEVSLSGSANL